MKLICGLALLLLAGCATMSAAPDSLDKVAADYVRMQLEMGAREEGYVDAYYGPAEWQAAAKAHPRAVAELLDAAAALSARTAALHPDDPLEQRRRAFMLAQLKAAETRMRMHEGAKLGFEEEAEGLFSVRPELKPLVSYDEVLERLERLVPGSRPLPERIEAFQNRFVIPPARLEPVMRAAIAECRRRTIAHIPLPPEEKFTLEFVTGKSWSGYNWYKGNATSLIQVNTDLPVRISRAVDLGCHEGYPGHHVYNMLLEQRLAKGRGWIEFTLYPLFSPQSFIAEGSANYGIDLAFPGDERLQFETGTLYPLAGLSPAGARDYLALQEALKALAGARFTIAADYLSGRIDRARALALTQRYQLVGEERAEQSLAFIDQYRSYVINYGLGQEMVKAHVERSADKWGAMVRLLSEPTLPSDLAGER
jgi:hypothetical protein